ncbi:phosphodiester glycosidase family protein [Brevibacillus composti]|uniref:Phosphodiester glycosidase family protein n=1 Tax=Brevibacillus composti TaxID=2796470 RepID=A0ABX7Z9P4_9BACL|nr:phosphodiester glycosidase family protein [Brevibacillus composti]QUO43073.1 phosphodiester glycosidase family protein [Brevibacillus composti]
MPLVLGKINRFFALLLAPAVGFLLAFSQANPVDQLPYHGLALAAEESHQQVALLTEQLDETKNQLRQTEALLAEIRDQASKEKEEFEKQNQSIQNLLAASKSQTQKSADVLDTILSNMLGNPIGQTFGKNATIKVYSLEEAGYRGYMAKVRLSNPNALRMVLANDSVKSRGETTSQAAKRTGAVLAINAGGFMRDKQGNLVPIGTTVVDGKIRTFSTNSNLSFVGFNKNGRLVGGKINSQEEITQKGILQGASFLPTLLQNGKRMPIPKEWANARQPRTLIGHFDNGDLLLIVIDGRRKGWSNGVTLEEAQRKLQEFHVVDAYNLDGGGSSAFYYKGKLLNRPSDGKERRVSSNLVIMP